jgi:hypothetical protein
MNHAVAAAGQAAGSDVVARIMQARGYGADVGGASPVPVQMWQGRVRSPCRCVCVWAGSMGWRPVPVHVPPCCRPSRFASPEHVRARSPAWMTATMAAWRNLTV